MTTRLFNGSTCLFNNAAVARLVGMQYRINGNPIDVTEPTDTERLFEVTAQEDLEVTIKVKRMPALTHAAKATLAITWADGSNTTLPGTWVVVSQDGGGDQDGPISGSVTFKPTVPDA